MAARFAPFDHGPLTRNLCEYRGGSYGITQRIKNQFALDFRGGKIPANFKGRFLIDGHAVYVFKSRKTPKMSGKRHYFHRIFFRIDGRMVPVGRARQALKCKLRAGGNTRKPRYH
jgi:hypothetical protein